LFFKDLSGYPAEPFAVSAGNPWEDQQVRVEELAPAISEPDTTIAWQQWTDGQAGEDCLVFSVGWRLWTVVTENRPYAECRIMPSDLTQPVIQR
jgi:hypothetical protein